MSFALCHAPAFTNGHTGTKQAQGRYTGKHKVTSARLSSGSPRCLTHKHRVQPLLLPRKAPLRRSIPAWAPKVSPKPDSTFTNIDHHHRSSFWYHENGRNYFKDHHNFFLIFLVYFPLKHNLPCPNTCKSDNWKGCNVAGQFIDLLNPKLSSLGAEEALPVHQNRDPCERFPFKPRETSSNAARSSSGETLGEATLQVRSVPVGSCGPTALGAGGAGTVTEWGSPAPSCPHRSAGGMRGQRQVYLGH